MNQEIKKIKRNGELIAYSECWQYWLYDDAIYSIGIDIESICLWCPCYKLAHHLHRLYQITDKKFFTENKNMQILNKEFLSQFVYA